MILDNSLVKYIKGWELSDKNNKVVTKHFSRANMTDMKSSIASQIMQSRQYRYSLGHRQPEERKQC